MALEIERRFLVSGQRWREHIRWSRALRQGYLVGSADGLTLRVRVDGTNGAWLTLKYPAAGIAREEFEYPIPLEDADALLQRCETALCKCRFGLNGPGGDWVLDVFEADNAPLVIAEVELASPEQEVPIPPWCVVEITGIGAFSNAALAATPFAQWPEVERRQWLARVEEPLAPPEH
jgi:CYTH domain-containing protein